MRIGQEYDFYEQKARVQASVDKMTLEELKLYFLTNYAEHYAQMGGHGGFVDISSMGTGFPEFMVRFNLVQDKLASKLSEREYDALVRSARNHPLVRSTDEANR